MANATTAKYEQLVLELATATSPATFARLCGLLDVTITRSANVDTTEVPDCDDESLPLSIEKQVRSIEISVSATGVWAQESHELLSDWFYSSTTLPARIGHLNALTGDTEYETGTALLTNLTNTRAKGQKVKADIELMFDGTPTRSVKV